MAVINSTRIPDIAGTKITEPTKLTESTNDHIMKVSHILNIL